MDISEGNINAAVERILIEGLSGGLGSLARNAPGVEEINANIIEGHIWFYKEVVYNKKKEKNDKKTQNQGQEQNEGN